MSVLSAEDRFEIQNLVTRYAYMVDDRDWDKVATVFTENLEMFIEGSGVDRSTSLSQARHLFAEVFNHPAAHVATTILIDPDPDLDSGALIQAMFLYPPDSDRVTFGRYQMKAVRTGSGWRIRSMLWRRVV